MKFSYLAIFLFTIASANALTQCNYFNSNHLTSDSDLLTTAQPASVGFNSDKLALVDKQISTDIKNGFPGAALLIIKDNKVIKQTVYGYRLKYNVRNGKKLKTPEPLHCNTLFDMASNTKMYATTYAVMHLVAQGKLDIHQKIKYYLPDYTGCDLNHECRDTRTIYELLTHTAGYPADPQFFNPEVIKMYGEGLYSQNRKQTQSILLHKLPFVDKPNQQPNYSDVDYMLLGMVIEKIAGMRLDKYVAKNIYEPLDLEDTMFNPLQHGISKNHCAATEISGNTRNHTVNFPNIRTLPIQCQVHDEKAYYSMAGVSGHAGLFSNLGDLAVLVQLMLNNGTYDGVDLWNSEVEKEFLTPLDSDNSFALGWRLAGSRHQYKPFGDFVSQEAYGHTGWTGTITLIDPKYNLAIILLTNKRHTPVIKKNFTGDNYATGQYHDIIDLIYKAFL